MKLQFIGAAREVTGSKYVLETEGRVILVDCGMEQGADTYENQELPVRASLVDCVVLTHAHIDHSGMLPELYKEGFRGPIYATPATLQLCDIMLRDSAHIQEQEAEWHNRKAERAGKQRYEPIYSMEDAEGALSLFQAVSYEKPREIMEGVSLVFTDAGHLLGSASATLTVREQGQSKRIVFSGDIGNLNQPILNDPQYLSQADYVVMESTYGDRLHGERPDYLDDLRDALQVTFDRGGNVVIPSFAVGRTQEILYFLREIKERGLVRGHEGFPVYLDSPLAIKATEIFVESAENNFDGEMRGMLERGINPISFQDLRLCITAEDSKRINLEKRPCVIISASGMAEAGRIRHHLKHNLWRENAMILFVGYQSEGTLGRHIVNGAKEVRLFQETIAVKAQVRTLKAISGHADRDGLVLWAQSFAPRPKRVFVCHGEEEVALSFAGLLEGLGHQTSVPYSGDAWDLMEDLQVERGSRALAEGVKKRVRALPGEPGVDELMQKALQGLQSLVRRSAGYSNGLKRKLTEQIEKLVRKWE